MKKRRTSPLSGLHRRTHDAFFSVHVSYDRICQRTEIFFKCGTSDRKRGTNTWNSSLSLLGSIRLPFWNVFSGGTCPQIHMMHQRGLSCIVVYIDNFINRDHSCPRSAARWQQYVSIKKGLRDKHPFRRIVSILCTCVRLGHITPWRCSPNGVSGIRWSWVPSRLRPTSRISSPQMPP